MGRGEARSSRSLGPFRSRWDLNSLCLLPTYSVSLSGFQSLLLFTHHFRRPLRNLFYVPLISLPPSKINPKLMISSLLPCPKLYSLREILRQLTRDLILPRDEIETKARVASITFILHLYLICV